MTEEGTTTEVTEAPTSQPDAIDTSMSRVHRFMVGDRVAMLHNEHDNLDVNQEGTVESFENAELTYMKVKFDDDSEEVLTEDDVRHLPPA